MQLDLAATTWKGQTLILLIAGHGPMILSRMVSVSPCQDNMTASRIEHILLEACCWLCPMADDRYCMTCPVGPEAASPPIDAYA